MKEGSIGSVDLSSPGRDGEHGRNGFHLLPNLPLPMQQLRDRLGARGFWLAEEA
jgi:hypothetical protein